MMRILADDPIISRGEPSVLESIQLEEITDPKKPRVSSPQIRSPRTIPPQPEVSRMPGGTGVPTPMFELRTIYDDEESLEVSLVTLVPIKEEKELEKASTPSPDSPIQNLSQSDHEVESVLGTKFLDLSRTPKYSSRDELESGGQKEEVQQQEANYQVSAEPTLGSSILVDTSLVDEKQMEVEPSKNMKEVQEPILEQIHTGGILGNTLTWGEKQILEPIDEVTDIQVISYDRKRKNIMKRTTKKRRLTLDKSILITTEEKLLNTEHAKTSQLIGAGMAITDATLDTTRRDEKELAATLKELEHLFHL
jgi:hypothetical protein